MQSGQHSLLIIVRTRLAHLTPAALLLPPLADAGLPVSLGANSRAPALSQGLGGFVFLLSPVVPLVLLQDESGILAGLLQQLGQSLLFGVHQSSFCQFTFGVIARKIKMQFLVSCLGGGNALRRELGRLADDLVGELFAG